LTLLTDMVLVFGPGTSVVSRAAESNLRDGALARAEHLTDLGCLIARHFGRNHRGRRASTFVVAASVVESPRPALDIARPEQRVNDTTHDTIPAGEFKHSFVQQM
jgi:hypothetical protein